MVTIYENDLVEFTWKAPHAMRVIVHRSRIFSIQETTKREGIRVTFTDRSSMTAQGSYDDTRFKLYGISKDNASERSPRFAQGSLTV